MSDIVERESTPEEAAALSAAQTKLAEMTPDVKRSEPTPGRPAVPPQKSADAIDATEAKRRELTAALIGGKLTPEEHAKKSAELRELVASQATAEEREEFVNLPIADIRDAMGVALPETMPASLVEKWDTDGEAEMLAGLHDAGVAPKAVEAIYYWYADKFVGAVGEVSNIDAAAMEAEFRQVAKKNGVKDSVVDALVKAHKARLG